MADDPEAGPLAAGGPVHLAEGSIYELLRRDPRIDFDSRVAHAGLIYEETSRSILAAAHRVYLAAAEARALPMLVLTDTWRASDERVAASRFAGRDPNGDNARFLRELVAGARVPVVIAGLTGPRGDAYKPQEAPRFDEALRCHRGQIERLAGSVDLLMAATLPAFEEARAIGMLMAGTGRPWILSFVVTAGGTLLDGTPLAAAIARIDDGSPRPPLGYAVNCTHPATLAAAARSLGPAACARVIGFQGNSSPLPPDQLDGVAELTGDAPPAYVAGIEALLDRLPLRFAGGCCGTGPEHVRHLAALLERRRA